MPEPATLAVFAAASLALLVVPGPSVLYIVARSLEQGRDAGLVSMLGVQAGGLVHVAAAAAGISALVASSATAFAAIKYAGAAYLIGLGIAQLRRRQPPEAATAPPPAPRARLFAQGVLVNVLNPKTAIFFLAFLPQFVDPDGAAVAAQVTVLGCCFIALAVLSDGTYVLVAGALAARLRRSAAARRRLDRISGTIYLGLGALAAASGERRG